MSTRLLAAMAAAAALAGLTGCAKEFPATQLSADEQQFEQSLRGENSADAKLALAQIYFTHNRIDEADALLAAVVQAEPANAQAQAWYGANNCKKAGRRGPWLMGFDKLYLVHECLGDVAEALRRAPDDFTVQMVQMNTGAEVDMFGSLDDAQRTKARVEQGIDAKPGNMPPDTLAQFYVTAAKIERKAGAPARAAAYLEQAAKLAGADPTREQIAFEQHQLASK